MLIKKREEIAKNLGCSMPLTEFDDAATAHAREIFADYQNRGIVLNESFDDEVWKTSNEAMNISVPLLPNLNDRKTEIFDWIGVDPAKYTTYVKTYIAFKFGDITLRTIQGLAKTLLCLPRMAVEDASELIQYTDSIAEFLSLLPGSTVERDSIIERLDEYTEAWEHPSGAEGRRVLSAFNSYLQFNEFLEKYWQTADDNDKLFYFPLYFWWNLTAILPLRPTEFLLTPRDCLEGNTLAVRRTKLKGSGKTAYRIAQDYELIKYEINSALANELRRYISLTENMKPTQIDTLIRLEPHYARIKPLLGNRNRYYNYDNMRTCIEIFFQKIIDPSGIKIERVKLGDTRHLAMINLIISGGSPVICRELAGHANIRISSHYYANLSNLVECMTLERFRKSKGRQGEFSGESMYPLNHPKDMTRLSEGWCDALSLKNGDVSECLKVIDGHGRIGECSSCYHYWSDVPGIRLKFFDEANGRQRVDLDGAFLMRTVETIRKGIGYSEDITTALLRLQHSCYHYSDCLTQKYINTEEA